MQDRYMQRYNFIIYKKACVNNVKEDITLCIDGERITLKVFQTQGHQGIHSKKIYQYLHIMTKSSVLRE